MADQSSRKFSVERFRLSALASRLLEDLKSCDQGLYQQLSSELGTAATDWNELTRSLQRLLNEQCDLDAIRNVAVALSRAQQEIKAPFGVMQFQQFLFQLLKNRLTLVEPSGSRRTAVEIVSRISSAAPIESAEILLGFVDDPEPAVAEAALKSLINLPLNAVPKAIGKLASLLPAPRGKTANALAICSALSLQANGAVESLPSLAWAVGNSEEQEVQMAAARAIARIDPDGDWLVYSIDDEEQRNRIMRALNEVGERSLLDILKDAWVVTASHGPRLGFKRMLRKEIGAYVYGIDAPAETPSSEKGTPQAKEAKRRADRISKRIDDWIETRRLRAIRVARGTYDVNVNDLEILRTIYLGRQDDAGEPTADDASSSDQ